MSLRLRAATLDDVPLLRHWDAQPHTPPAEVDEWRWEQELGDPQPWRGRFIAELDGRPIGFLAIDDPAHDDYWDDVREPGLRALDIWIGEARDLGQGHGTRMMELAIERCFAEPEVVAILLDPLQGNTRARRFHERLGFRFVEDRRFGDDDCAIYRLERADWLKRRPGLR